MADVELPKTSEINRFRKILLKWFSENQREFPWRKTKNPYRILIAEIMLQRTRADQVLPVYKHFFKTFKSPADVMNAGYRKLHGILGSLGLHWRIKKIKKVSKELVEKYKQKIPDTREGILHLTGVGDYIAGMVLSLAYAKKEWVVDSNVVRIFKRYFGLKTSREGRRDRQIIELARKYVSLGNARNNNLAIIDYTTLICTPLRPKCDRCRLSFTCKSYNKCKIIK